jgi:hypothetical protein
MKSPQVLAHSAQGAIIIHDSLDTSVQQCLATLLLNMRQNIQAADYG